MWAYILGFLLGGEAKGAQGTVAGWQPAQTPSLQTQAIGTQQTLGMSAWAFTPTPISQAMITSGTARTYSTTGYSRPVGGSPARVSTYNAPSVGTAASFGGGAPSLRLGSNAISNGIPTDGPITPSNPGGIGAGPSRYLKV